MDSRREWFGASRTARTRAPRSRAHPRRRAERQLIVRNDGPYTPGGVNQHASRGEILRAVSLAVFAGLLVRALPAIMSDFPLNDGGLFYAMTGDVQQAGYLLPNTSSYNGLDIPFAYPPLGFYLAGLTSDVVGISLVEVFRFLPLIAATLMIPVVYLLAREILSTHFQALLATWALAFLPRSFEWLVVGGGLTRSLGLLFALLMILEGVRFYKTTRRRHGLWMALFAGLTALSHPEAALFAAISMILMLLAYGRTRLAARDSLILAGVAAIVASPWWLTVISRHGLSPFVSGGQATLDPGATVQYLATFTFTDEPYLTLLGVLGLVGFVHQLAMRRYLLPAWIVVVFALDPRGAATSAMVPLALLIAIAVDEVLLARLSDPVDRSTEGSSRWDVVVRDRFGRALLVTGLVFGILGAVKAPIEIGSPLDALPAPNREAMAWIAANAPGSAEFLVITGSQWFLDADAEWFPVLAGHRSLSTVQGYEWLGKTAWDQQERRNDALQSCAYETRDCLAEWTQAANLGDAWVYVPVQTISTLSPTGDCCAGLRASLASDPGYTVAYEGPGGVVLKPGR